MTDGHTHGVGADFVAERTAEQVGLEIAAQGVPGIQRGVGTQPEARELGVHVQVRLLVATRPADRDGARHEEQPPGRIVGNLAVVGVGEHRV